MCIEHTAKTGVAINDDLCCRVMQSAEKKRWGCYLSLLPVHVALTISA